MNARVLTQAEALDQLFDAKAFSWTLAMEAMEKVLPAGVQVTSIEPMRDKDGHITVHVRVVGPRDRADDLVANLEHSRRFLQPRIVGETAESTNGPLQRQDPISSSNRFDFELLADYNPPSPEERAANERTAAKSARGGSEPGPPSAGRRSPRARLMLSRRQMAASPMPDRLLPGRRPMAQMQTPFKIPRLEVRNEHKRIFLAVA